MVDFLNGAEYAKAISVCRQSEYLGWTDFFLVDYGAHPNDYVGSVFALLS
jgi:hypothetical protein